MDFRQVMTLWRTNKTGIEVEINYLPDKFLGSTLGLNWLLIISHLKTCKIQNSIVSGKHPCYGSVSIPMM